MRKLIAAMKISLDAKCEGPDGAADWVAAWSDDYGLTSQIDACVLGSEMYAGYEPYWTGIQDDPKAIAWITGAPPTQGELEWAEFAKRTPHYVLSRTRTSANWPNVTFIQNMDDIAALKKLPGKDIYLMGGARLVSMSLDAGLVDELRVLMYPLIAGEGKSLFATMKQRHGLALQRVEQRDGGIVSLVYAITNT